MSYTKEIGKKVGWSEFSNWRSSKILGNRNFVLQKSYADLNVYHYIICIYIRIVHVLFKTDMSNKMTNFSRI